MQAYGYSFSGGAVATSKSVKNFNILKSSFVGNYAEKGAAISYESFQSTSLIDECYFSSNEATIGAGLSIFGAERNKIQLRQSTFVNSSNVLLFKDWTSSVKSQTTWEFKVSARRRSAMPSMPKKRPRVIKIIRNYQGFE